MTSPPPSRHSSDLPCLTYAVAAGCMATVSVNVAAYPAYLEASGRWPPFTNIQRIVISSVSVALAAAQCLIFLVALSCGPMSLAVMVSCAVALITNMLVQMTLHIRRYPKSTRTGILVLACAVLVLVDTGPTRPEDQDLGECFLSWGGCVCILLQIGLIGLGLTQMRRTRESPATSFRKTGIYALVSATATILAASSAKAVLEAFRQEVYLWIIVWFSVGCLAGALMLIVDAAAMVAVDISVYVPMARGLQLLEASMVGLFLWKDHSTIEAWTAYAMVHALLALGVYQVSSVDLVRGVKTWWSLWSFRPHKVDTSGGTRLDFGLSVKRLREVWQFSPQDEVATGQALEEMLVSGLQQGIIEPASLRELVMILARRHHEMGPAGVVMDWFMRNALLGKVADPEPDLEDCEDFPREAMPGAGLAIAGAGLASIEVPLLMTKSLSNQISGGG